MKIKSKLLITVLATFFGTGMPMAQTFNEFTIPTANSTPQAIIVGPDDALWFTEQASNKIGRITSVGHNKIENNTTAVVITEFPVTTASSMPTGITVGPDNALWFTEYSGNNIGRIT